MYEKIEMFLEKQYDMIVNAKTHAEKRTFFDQAFGGVSFAIQMCGDDWDEANRYIDRWSNIWYPRLIKEVYGYDVEVN